MTQRIAFIDTSLVDYRSLVAALHPSIKVVLISPLQDGWRQVANALARFSHRINGTIDARSIDAIDIISHGAPGSVMLGSGVLNASTLPAYAATLGEIGHYLAADADILLYGCDVGAGSAGSELLDQLAFFTGANIAASTNITGDAAMGGNWLLDASAGFVNTAALQVPAYAGILALNTAPLVNEFQVNSTTASEQQHPSITALADGGYVVSWMSYEQDGSVWGIYAQRYNANGNAFGGEVRVNSTTASEQQLPSITALTDGGYVVSWMSFGQDGSGWGIYAQRYNANGSALGAEVRVNTTTQADQWQPSITGLKDGGYLVSWTSNGQDGSGYDIYAQRYNASGIAEGGEERVNTITLSEQQQPSITGLAEGSYVVSWMSLGQDGSGYGIYAQKYGPSGIKRTPMEVLVNTATLSDQVKPTITGLTDGGYVVSWTSLEQDGSGYGIYVQRYSGGPVPSRIGGEIQVNTTTLNHQVEPAITGLTDGGYVVSWTSLGQDGSGYGIYAQRYNASGTGLGIEVQVNNTTLNHQVEPAITGLTDGGYVVSWMSLGQDGSGSGIYAQRFDAGGNRVTMALQGNAGDNNLVWTGSGAVILDGDAGNDILTGGAGDDIFTGGAGNDRLTGNGGNDSALYSGNSAGYTFSQLGNNLIITDTNLVDGNDGVDTLSGVENLTFTDGTIQATKLGEVQVNSTTLNNQQQPSITGLNDGSYVVSWTSFGQDGSGLGIYAQRYDAGGSASGAEVRVNTTTASEPYPSITALTDGGYVVSWMSFGQDGSGWGIYAQRYDAGGSASGTEVRVNSTTLNNQQQPSITGLADGGYVVSWMSAGQDGSGWGIYAQRYDASGTALGAEVQVNTTSLSDQQQPSITGLADGGFVVSWDSFGQEGIYTQRYNANGTALGTEVRVNTTTRTYQYDSSITALADGGYVVSWTSSGFDGSNPRIYVQRYNASGTALDFKLQGDAGNNTLTWVGSSNVILAGDSGNDVLQGGDGNDTLNDIDSSGLAASNSLAAGAGNDTIHVLQSHASSVTTVSGGSGRDSYLLQANSIGQLLVSDFAAGASGDILNINALLTSSSGFSSGNPFDATLGYLRLLQQGADTLLQWDRDGAATATNNWQTVITLQNTSATALTVDNFAPATGITSINVVQSNTAPVLSVALADQMADEDAAFNFVVPASAFSDPDTGDTQSYSASLENGAALPAWLSFNANTRSFSGTPSQADVATFDVRVTVTDAGGLSTNDVFTLTVNHVNDAPTGTATAALITGTEDTAYTINASDLLQGFIDVDGDTLTVSGLTADHGSITNNNNGSYTFNPAANYNGSVSLNYNVIDGNGGSVAAGQSFSLAAVNDAPVIRIPVALSFASRVDYGTGAGPRYVTSADINGDGNADLLVANHSSNSVSVLSNNGNGTFATKVDYTTGANPYTITSADVNGDGQVDLIVANFNSNSVSVLSNNGGGTFATKVDYATGFHPISATSADVNGDGKVDLLVANWDSSTVSVLTNNGNGTFAAKADYAAGSRPYSITSADVNGDGKADMIVANQGSSTVSVLTNNGEGTFATKVDYATGSGPYSVTSADVNGDGKADLIVANASGNSVSVLTNNGDGTFAAKVDYATGTGPLSVTSADVTSADVNGDGKADLIVANASGNSVSVLTNNGDGTFAAKVDYATGAEPNSVTSADVNGDGKADLIVANFISNTVSVLTNNSNGIVTAFTEQTPVAVSSGLTLSDQDGNADWNGGQLKIQITANNQTSDSLSLVNTNPGGSAIWLNPTGNQLMAGATQIGIADATSVNYSTAWTFTFNASATNALAQDVARAVLFNNSSDSPNPLSRTVTFTATDALGLSASANQTVTIAAVNDVPTTTPVTLTAIAEDSGARLITQAELLVNASDIDGDSLTAIGLAIATGNGSLIDNLDGSWSYTPATDDNTAVSFSYGVRDGNLTANTSATLDLTPVNDAPVAVDNILAATEDTTVIYTAAELLGNDTDIENDTLSIASVTSGAGGTAVLNTDGSVSFTPDANFNGAASFSYIASDGSTSSNSASVTVNVAPVNDVPTGTASATLIAGTEDTAYTISSSDLLQGFTDVDGDTLTVSALAANHGTLTDNNNGSFTFNPAANYNGSVSLTYNVIDGNGGTVAASQTVSLAAVNDVALIGGNATVRVTEDGTLFASPALYGVGANNPYSVVVADVNGDGRPDLITADYYSNAASVLLNDDNGGFAAPTVYAVGATGTASVAVADLNSDGRLDIVTAGYDSNAVSVLLNDGNGGFAAPTLYTVGASYPIGLAVADMNGDGRSDLVTADFYSNAVSVLLNDGNGGFAAPTVYAVGASSPVRLAVADLNSDGRVDIVTADYNSNAVSVLLNDGNGGFAAPTVYAVAAFGPASVTVADVNGDGRLDLVTANSFSNAVSVLLNDGNGGFAAPTLYTVGASYPIGVAVADLNIDGRPDIVTADYNNNSVSVLLNNGSTASGTLTISDVDVGEAKFQAPIATALLGVYGDFVFNDTTGAWIYTLRNSDANVQALSAGQQVTDSLTVTSFDGSASQTITVTVTGTNDVPVLTTQTANATEDGAAITINALATASDVDTGATLTVVNIPAQLPAGVTYNGTTHNFTLDPSNAAYQVLAAGQSTTVTVNYGVSDGIATTNTSVSFSVTGTNDAPTGTASAALIAGTEDTAYTINASDLLQGFTDVDGDVLSVSALTADHGTLTDNNNGSFTFNPDANYNGNVSLTYSVIDGNGGSLAASQTVSLAAVNDVPVAVNNILAATEDTTVIYTAAELLGNDTDIENDTLSIAAVTSGAGGIAVLNTDGSVSFTPDANFNGAASFSYTASDGSASSNSASVTVNVAPVNDAPILNSPLADRAFTRASAFVFAIPTGSFTDVDGDNLTYTAILADGNALPSWLQFNAGTGTFSGNPAIPDVGDLNVRVTAIDPEGLFIDDVFVLNITTLPTDLVGTANADSLTGTNGNDIIYGLAGNDQLNGGAGSDQLVGGAGNDQLNGGAGSDTMYGGLGDDTYVVNVAGDVIVESILAGRDTVRSSISYTLGANLEDLILTGTVNNNGTGNGLNNVLTGNSGDNTLAGDAGNDQLFGQGGNDTLNGGLGDDILNGGTGRDALIGGVGNDTYVIDDTGDTATELSAQGMDTVQSYLGSYTLTANIENLVLLGAATTGTGNGLNNVITGNSLNNVLRGGAGNDQLFGLGGNDTLTGGTGNDQFVFSTTPAAGNVDRVTDFIVGQDQLVLDALVFTGLNLHNQTLDTAMFRSGAGITTAADADDRVIFNTTNGALYYDADGAGGTAAVQFATILGVSTLNAGSIWVMG